MATRQHMTQHITRYSISHKCVISQIIFTVTCPPDCIWWANHCYQTTPVLPASIRLYRRVTTGYPKSACLCWLSCDWFSAVLQYCVIQTIIAKVKDICLYITLVNIVLCTWGLYKIGKFFCLQAGRAGGTTLILSCSELLFRCLCCTAWYFILWSNYDIYIFGFFTAAIHNIWTIRCDRAVINQMLLTKQLNVSWGLEVNWFWNISQTFE